MTVFIQGLRRSGTTILFDVLTTDNEIFGIYEPFSAGKKTIGGGSGARKEDLTKTLREIRVNFLKENKNFNHKSFNRGSPTQFRKEVFNSKLTKFEYDYIKSLANVKNSYLKFTRASFIVKELYGIDSHAKFIHIIKNPALWVASHMLGKKNKFPNADAFFNCKTGFDNWSQERISNFYIKEKYPCHINKSAVFKLLLIWRDFNLEAEAACVATFGSNYLKIFNDDLCTNTEAHMNKVYNFLEVRPNKKAIRWATNNISGPKKIMFQNDQRWRKYFDYLVIRKSFLDLSK